MKPVIEICCGSALDVIAAARGGANRAELNSALALGGLTPSLGNLTEAAEKTGLPIIVMIRTRGAGFCYSDDEFTAMKRDAQLLLQHGAAGLAFGSLNADRTINENQTRELIDLAHAQNKEFVFHRALDCAMDPETAIMQLIRWKADRILTSGCCEKAVQGSSRIAAWQKQFGSDIEILAGSGVNAQNAKTLLKQTGIRQLHSSCKDWLTDPTTSGNQVTYGYAAAPHELDYDCVSADKVRELINAVMEI